MEHPRIDNNDSGRRPSRRRRLERTLIIATAFTLPVAAWGVAGSQLDDAVAAAADPPAAVSAPAVAGTVGEATHTYAPVVETVVPAVVTIRAEVRGQPISQQFPFADDPFFREFFGNRIPRGGGEQAPMRQGLGSGVIVTSDGYILTNHHVIDDAERVTVELNDRRSFTAKIVGSDQPSDLAVLKIEATGLPTVPLGDSDNVRVGDVVLAIGNPLGVGQTVTMGIVSAKGRATGFGDGSFEDFIQTDAPINRGNSGGALVSTRGQLVGINSQIVSPSGGNIGIGFAIPANMAKNVMDALIANGRVDRGMLGVTVQSLNADLAAGLGVSSARGAVITSVNEDGPADEAGLERGDIVTAIDGRTVADSNELRNRIAGTKPGSRVNLTVVRDGKERNVTATLAQLPSNSEQGGGSAESPASGSLGLEVRPVPADRAGQLGLDAGKGLLVANVRPGSPAANAGFRPGDVIEEVDRTPIGSVAALRDAVDKAGDGPVLVLVRRGEGAVYLTIRK